MVRCGMLVRKSRKDQREIERKRERNREVGYPEASGARKST